MKKYFKKSLAVFMAMLMLLSVMGVSVFAATYKLEYLPGRYSTDTAPDAIMVEGNTTVILAGAIFTREGYIQAGWSTAQAGTRKNYDLGQELKITKNTKLYPYWEAAKVEVTFAPGAYGTGSVQTDEADEGKSVRAPGAIFTREGYIQIGWTSVDGGALEFGLNSNTPAITAPITFYPAWEKCDYSVDVSASGLDFGNVCEGYAAPAKATVVITNEGNMTLTYTLPSNANYNITVKSGSLTLAAGASVTIEIAPKTDLTIADYSGDFVFDCDYDVSDVAIAVRFIVGAHSFSRYVSNNDATYDSDGTKSAECLKGCGFIDTIADPGTMKVYSVDNNTVIGLLKEYVHHRTVNFTAYGSGYDDEDGIVGKRFVPATWYVNEDFNGEFVDGDFDVTYTHTVFGDYTLAVTYYEEEIAYNEATDEYEWVATGVTDEKVFEYSVGTNEYEEQEIVRPNTILSIIFGLFAKLLSLLGIGG